MYISRSLLMYINRSQLMYISRSLLMYISRSLMMYISRSILWVETNIYFRCTNVNNEVGINYSHIHTLMSHHTS
jgi:hypothetical protein